MQFQRDEAQSGTSGNARIHFGTLWYTKLRKCNSQVLAYGGATFMWDAAVWNCSRDLSSSGVFEICTISGAPRPAQESVHSLSPAATTVLLIAKDSRDLRGDRECTKFAQEL